MSDPTLNKWVTSERIRYLSAFSSMWSSFNDFYRRDGRFTGTDRDALKAIQNLPYTDPLFVAFESICASDDRRVEENARLIQDAATRGVASYEATTRFSALVAEIFSNPILTPSIWIGGQTRPPGRVTLPLPCVHIPSAVYLSWYRELRASEAEPDGMPDSSITVQEALAHYGIASDGCVFFLAQPKPTKSAAIANILKNRLSAEQHFNTLLNGVMDPKHAWVPSTRFAITLELLYLIRNNIMHGALDPTDVLNDPIGKVGYEVLCAWLLEVSK